ncbi:MAG: hypothetical protein ABI744_04210 [Chloroflexota bacterium]
MIRIRTAIRMYPAVWLAPMLIVLCIWYARAMVFRSDPDPYLPSLSAQPMSTQGLVAPILAALAAWESARLRRGGIWQMSIVRRRIAVVAWPLVIIWAVGFVAVASGVVAVLVAKGFLIPDPRPLAVAGLVLGAHTLAGFAFGLLLPIVVAAPVAMAVSLLWQVMPRAIEPLWTHLLTSQQLETCCAVDTDIGVAALAAPALVALGVAVAAAIVIAGKRTPATAALTVAALAAGLVSASVIASSEPRGDVGVARNEAVLQCSGAVPEVCLWPEHASRLSEVSGIVRAAATAWTGIGVQVPTRFDEAFAGAVRPGTLHFRLWLGASRDHVIDSISYEMVPGYIDCPGAYMAAGAFDPLRAWYAATAGMSAEALGEEFGSLRAYSEDFDIEVLALVDDIRSQSPDRQREWVERNTWALGACDRSPDLRPAHP